MQELYRDKLCQNLSDETERLIEDVETAKKESLSEWSKLFWKKVNLIIEMRSEAHGKYNMKRFQFLESRCIEEYQRSIPLTISKLREELRLCDEKLLAKVDELSEEKDAGYLVTDCRIEKRCVVERELDREHEVFLILESLHYEDFCDGGRSCKTHCFC